MNTYDNDNEYILAVVKWIIGGMIALGGIAIAAIRKEKIVPVLKSLFGIDVSDDVAEDMIEKAKEEIEGIDGVVE